jgi:NADPH-dependent curcumin reductase CurA
MEIVLYYSKLLCITICTNVGQSGLGFITAWSAIEVSQLKAGESIVIIGAKGAVGSAAAQVSKAKKAYVIGASIVLFYSVL